MDSKGIQPYIYMYILPHSPPGCTISIAFLVYTHPILFTGIIALPIMWLPILKFLLPSLSIVILGYLPL